MNQNAIDNQPIILTDLLQLQKSARHAASEVELGFIFVNESKRIIPYQQAVFWSFDLLGKVQVKAASAVETIDPHSPYVQWLKKLIRQQAVDAEANESHALSIDLINDELRDGWREWCAGQMLWLPLRGMQSQLIAGLLLMREPAYAQAEFVVMEQLTDAYAHAYESMRYRHHGTRWHRLKLALPAKRWRLAFLVIMLAAFFLPVHESALAPAEVVARKPVIVSSPVQGVIDTFSVQPNQRVKQGDVLFRYDDTGVRNQKLIAEKELSVAQADYLRARQKAFDDEQGQVEVTVLRARVIERQARLDYQKELLGRSVVYAERAGIAVFSNQDEWLGKPMVIGEKVMILADPAHVEIKIWLPAADAISLEKGAAVRLFLNTDPTHPRDGKLTQTSYEAEINAEGVLAFQLKADIEGNEPLRIGLKATAKVYGESVSLGYYLFRRPFSFIRSFFGI